MARSRRGFSQGHTRPRRTTEWGFGPGGNTVQIFSASGEAILGSGISADEEVTIVRLRGLLSCYLTTTVAGVNEGFHGAVGIGICTEDAFGVGTTAMPDPLADLAWDGWMWHSFFDIHANTSTLSDGVNAVSASQRIEVDSKAMRRLMESDVLFAKVEVVEAGTASMGLFFESRVLIKLA